MRILVAILAVPTIVLAQASFPTEWPSGAQELTPEALRARIVGKVFIAKPVTGPEVRTQYQETRAYLNVGSTSDSGPWKTEGSSLCIEWKTLRASCTEIRSVGDVLYAKRANNGEIIPMLAK